MRRKNTIAVTIVVVMLLALGVATCARFADNDTKARLYGCMPGGAPPVEEGSTTRP